MPGTQSVGLSAANGFLDLSGSGFESTIYSITGEWESYPEKLDLLGN
jgi:hypothetical protein